METALRSQGRVENGARLHIEPREYARYERPALDRIGSRTIVVPEPRPIEKVVELPVIKAEIAQSEILPSIEEPAQATVRKHFTPPKRKKGRRLAVVAVLGLLVIGGSVFALRRPAEPTSQVLAAHTETVEAAVADESVATTDDTPPADYLSAPNVSGTSAKILSLGKLGITAPVVAVGVDGRGHPQQPKHTYQVGWYDVSVHPGEIGATVLSGACHGAYGVFKTLMQLKPDDEVTLERGDGTLLRYSVVRTEDVTTDKLDTTKLLRPVDSEVKGLNLITCAGWYDANTNDYSERFVVYTKQI